MAKAFANTLRYTLVLIAGIVLALIVLSAIAGNAAKDALSHAFSMISARGSLADAMCTVPANDKNDVYFVSCGGFF